MKFLPRVLSVKCVCEIHILIRLTWPTFPIARPNQYIMQIFHIPHPPPLRSPPANPTYKEVKQGGVGGVYPNSE